MAGVGRAEALFKAVDHGNVEEVERLLDKDGGLLEARDEDSWNMTPLIWASHIECAEVVRLLLDRGAELEARDVDGDTAFIRAASCGQEEIVDMLLRRGADVRARNINRVTPLHEASKEGRLEVVRLLTQQLRGQSLNDVDIRDRTALWRACRYGHMEVARVLLLAGADHTIAAADRRISTENNEITPLEAAQGKKHDDTATLLQVIAHERLDVHTMHESSAANVS
jgi:ankyrin repeat protein